MSRRFIKFVCYNLKTLLLTLSPLNVAYFSFGSLKNLSLKLIIVFKGFPQIHMLVNLLQPPMKVEKFYK